MNKKTLPILILLLCLLLTPSYSKAQDETISCPANSYLSGDQCLCNSGYVSPSGSSGCIPESQACSAYGPSHLVGNDCVCDSGYGILPGSGICQSLSAACAKYNAVWSDSAGDCICPSGWHEDTAANTCVQDEPTPKKTDSTPPAENVPVETTDIPDDIPTAEKPVIQPVIDENTIPVITKIELPPVPADNKFTILDDLMQPVYDQYPPAQKTFVIEAQPLLEERATQDFPPILDMYDLKFNEPLKLGPVITESLTLTSAEAQQIASQQLNTISEFSSSDTKEITINSQSVLETVAENLTDQAFMQELIDYHQQVTDAKKNLVVKPGVDKEKLATDLEIEKKLKWQIANLEQIIRYSHMRIVEVTSHLRQLGPSQTQVNFDQMPSDYREFFHQQSGSSDFEETEEGIQFNKAFANAVGASQQIKDLKTTLQKNYPAGWQEQYFDLPAKPTRSNTRQKIDKNIFLYMMDKSNLSI